ncbi:type II toxin-antitoxin system antitoxin [Enterococcus sp. LJL128]|uniref:ribbon-helix-helix domain-containing protein n=1 Tax=Enterococcus sp. LJL51 TaxID=3416656 RepID=UPI003CE7D744
MEKKEQKAKKQVPLRLSAALYNELAAWAEDEFRSVNGQIEYLLTENVKRRKRSSEKKPNDD